MPLSSTAGEHFAGAERILAALPIVKRSADRDRRVQIALVHPTLAVAAGRARRDRRRSCARLAGHAEDFAAGRALPPMQLVRWDEEREWVEPWADGAASHGQQLRWQTFLMP